MPSPLTDLSSYYSDSNQTSDGSTPRKKRGMDANFMSNYLNQMEQTPAPTQFQKPPNNMTPMQVPQFGQQTNPNALPQYQPYGQQSYAAGGQTKLKGPATNVAAAAQGLASLGRKNDTMLVHMSPMEYQGLQGLAAKNGIQLTRNPMTGLPEAFQLDQMLPAVAGIAAAAMTGGAAAPLVAGAVTGGLTYAKTGNLQQGLMAGLMAGGTAGVGSAAGAAGAAADTGATAATTAATEAGTNAATQTAAQTAGQAAGEAGGQAAGTSAASSAGTDMATQLTGHGPGQTFEAMSPMDRLSAMGKGISNPNTLANAMMSKSGAALGVGALGTMMNAQNPSASAASPYPSNYNPVGHYNRKMVAPSAGYNVTNSGEWNYFPNAGMYQAMAHGGVVMAHGGAVADAPIHGGIAAFDQGGDMTAVRMLRRAYPTRQLAEEAANKKGSVAQQLGVTSDDSPLLDYAYGPKQMLHGAGDGMSDDINTSIEGRQPAKLSRDEFVIPADVVSHLGNGSSSAGADQLYRMMDRVRKARTGHEKQGREIKAEKYMPA